jgi:hypothetical protein
MTRGRLALGLAAGQDLLDLRDVAEPSFARGAAEAEPSADGGRRRALREERQLLGAVVGLTVVASAGRFDGPEWTAGVSIDHALMMKQGCHRVPGGGGRARELVRWRFAGCRTPGTTTFAPLPSPT